MDGGHEQWELSKENVQPIRQGRKMTALTAALQPIEGDTQTNFAIQQQIQHFETEIRMYQGDDPFSVWYQYVKWTEQNFPKGGKDSNLPALLERCVTHFKDYKQYHNDERYIDTWLKFCNCCTDKIEIYQFLNDQGIGWKCASLYEAWATELEKLGGTKKADAVYSEGIAKHAEPREKLQRLHREFQCRVARQAVEEEDEQDGVSSDGGQRVALGGLKPQGKKVKKAPNVRVGPHVQAKSRGLGTLSALPTDQPNAVVQVFDENAVSSGPSGSLIPGATGEWSQLAPRKEHRKENVQNPGKWNTHRIPQRRGTASGADGSAQPAFSVHEDEGAAVYMTPRKLPEMGNQVLSARKPEKPTFPLEHMARTTDDSGQKFEAMYCKDLVYAGVREMSLEELRALKYREKAAQKAIKEQQELLRRQQEELMLQQQQFQEEQRRIMEENRRFFELQRQQIEADRNRMLDEQRKVLDPRRPAEPNRPLNTERVTDHHQAEPVRRQLSIGQATEPLGHPQQRDQATQPFLIARDADRSHQQQLQVPMDGVAYQSQQLTGAIAGDVAPSPASMDGVAAAQSQQAGRKPFVIGTDANPYLCQQQRQVDVQQGLPFDIARDADPPCRQSRPMPGGNAFQPKEMQRQPFNSGTENNPPHPLSQPTESNLTLRPESQRSLFAVRTDPVQPEKTHSANRFSLPTLDKSLEKDQDFTVTQRLNFEDTTTSSTGSLSGRIMAPQSQAYNIPTATPSAAAQPTPQMPAQVTKTPNSMFVDTATSQKKTPVENLQNLSSDYPTPLGTPGHLLVAPSPTVHTKEALGVIEAMFNDPFLDDLDDSIRRGVSIHRDEGFGGVCKQTDEDFEAQFAHSGNFQHAPCSVFSLVGGASSHPFAQPGGFAIFDENAENMTSKETDKENQENRPTQNNFKLSVSGERRPLVGVLQPSKDLEVVMPQEDQENQVPIYTDAKESKADMENDMLDGIDMLQIHDRIDTTTYETTQFTHHGSKEFQAAARMASTPFNLSACPPPLPCSTIRQPSEDRSSHRRVSLGESLHVAMMGGEAMSDITMEEALAVVGRDAGSHGSEDVKMSLGNRLSVESKNGGATAGQAQRVVSNGKEDSFEATISNPPPATPLSPILETSAEDAQSSKSSAGSSGIASHLSVHQHSNVTIPSMHHVEDVAMASPAATTKSRSSLMMSEHLGVEAFREAEVERGYSSTLVSHASRSSAGHSVDDVVMQSPLQNVDTAPRNRSMDASSWRRGEVAPPQSKSPGFSLPTFQSSKKPAPAVQQQRQDHTSEDQELTCELSFYNYLSTPKALGHKEDEPMTLTASPQQQSLNQSSLPSHNGSGSPPTTEGVDPFNKAFIDSVLATIPRPLESYPGYLKFYFPMPDIFPQLALDIESDLIKVEKLLGKGAFAQIYQAEKLDATDFAALDCSDKIILKVQQPAWPWEFYMVSEAHERLRQLNEPVNVNSAIMGIDKACIYDDSSMLTSQLHSSVTLLDLINLYKGGRSDKVASCMPQPIILFYTIELLNIVDQLHKCGIIHADLKPDNLIVRNIDRDIDINEPITEVEGLLLIDFGQSIDMRRLPEGTTFMSSCNTSGFMCHEMQQGQPWTYQTDYYGIAATVFCMMFGVYMRTHKQGDQWKISRKPFRWFNAQLWDEFFRTLLNVPSCRDLPSLSALRDKLQAYLQTFKNADFRLMKRNHDVMLFEGSNK